MIDVELMLERVTQYQAQIAEAISETLMMVGISLAAAILLGLPLGVLLFFSAKGQLYENRFWNQVLNGFVNIIRSFPFLLFVVFMIPVTRWLIGTAIGTLAASVPLAVVSLAIYSRQVEQALHDVPRGILEAARAMGATRLQIMFKFLLVEARSGLILGLTNSMLSFISYSTVMGVVGGGGVGDFAIRYGYQRFETELMLAVILLMIVIVQFIQLFGSLLSRWLDKR